MAGNVVNFHDFDVVSGSKVDSINSLATRTARSADNQVRRV